MRIFRKWNRKTSAIQPLAAGCGVSAVQGAGRASAQATWRGMHGLQTAELGCSLCKSMIMCIYSALSWSDTQTCIKSLGMCGPVFQQIVGRPLLPEAAKYLLTCFLRGLQVHGQHEACMAWLVQRTIQHYEVLRPMHDNVQEVMLQVPGVSTETLEAFDNRYIFNKDHKKPASEKNKRDNFKKLISGIIGTPVGQMFKREIVIQNLEPMRKPAKQRIPDVTEQGGDAGLVTLFAHDS